MQRFVVPAVLAANLCVIVIGRADEPDNRQDLKTYTVACRLFQKALLTNTEGKVALETIEGKMPNIVTLAGTRAEYRARGFQLGVKVVGNGDNTVRLTLKAEVGSAYLRVVRQARLGRAIRLDVDGQQNGEAVWLELTVHETPPE